MPTQSETSKTARFQVPSTTHHREQQTRSGPTAVASYASYPPNQSIQLIRLPDLRKRLGGVGRSTIYDWLNPNSPRHDPQFPVPLKLSYTGGAIAWIQHEVDDWLATRVRVR